eukprot:CAMPEP_0183322866 /NCGR_PEP_ID=MMETSP0160_2-20130417/72879_1 /TAXON_ID=2839 ORGANISM="Odontella Sinensis, Strain Grunow 1884" /NCGR_SAMPLE_ID=MMETSP0160_2 /ASSEMBLY_ACC=CAM_ASM_000250 /LENGTH=239 /DNA_ID=CAMNT_0025490123 /DNA_START=57 /DNA_END=773 /DNA_ORIENTATION=+
MTLENVSKIQSLQDEHHLSSLIIPKPSPMRNRVRFSVESIPEEQPENISSRSLLDQLPLIGSLRNLVARSPVSTIESSPAGSPLPSPNLARPTMERFSSHSSTRRLVAEALDRESQLLRFRKGQSSATEIVVKEMERESIEIELMNERTHVEQLKLEAKDMMIQVEILRRQVDQLEEKKNELINEVGQEQVIVEANTGERDALRTVSERMLGENSALQQRVKDIRKQRDAIRREQRMRS